MITYFLKHYLVVLTMVMMGFLASAQSNVPEVMPYEVIEEYIESKRYEGKPVVVNFWATWCGPCVKELPYFKELQEEDVAEMVYVSMDFVNQLERKLVPFLKENPFMKSNTYVVDQRDANEWIPQVDENWSGAIPATWLFTGEDKKFHEGYFSSAEELRNFILN